MYTKEYCILKTVFHKRKNSDYVVEKSNNSSPAVHQAKCPAPLHNKQEALIVIWLLTVMIISHV